MGGLLGTGVSAGLADRYLFRVRPKSGLVGLVGTAGTNFNRGLDDPTVSAGWCTVGLTVCTLSGTWVGVTGSL